MQTQALEQLRLRLIETQSWPLRYMFKFIVPNRDGRVERVVACLPPNGNTTYKTSRDLHYVAVSHIAIMPTADSIIDVIAQATTVEGVIAL